LFGFIVHSFQLCFGRDPQIINTVRKQTDGIALHPLFHFFFCTILCRVGHRMSAEAIGFRFHEDRQVFCSRTFYRTAHYIAHF